MEHLQMEQKIRMRNMLDVYRNLLDVVGKTYAECANGLPVIDFDLSVNLAHPSFVLVCELYSEDKYRKSAVISYREDRYHVSCCVADENDESASMYGFTYDLDCLWVSIETLMELALTELVSQREQQ